MREKATRESLEKLRLMDELKFLKAQINPHFLMNSLNNIHSMIEIDSAKAQDMTLELSRLMRYVLYEGANATASFADEVAFILNYVSLMRCRYPDSKVQISVDVPKNPSRSVVVPSMLLVTFVENAFKHGVSAHVDSFVTVDMGMEEGNIVFTCINSVIEKTTADYSGSGIGIENMKRRLELLYPGNYSYEQRQENGKYIVKVRLKHIADYV